MSRAVRTGGVLVVGLAAAVAWACGPALGERHTEAPRLIAEDRPRTVTRNIEAADYAGSLACAGCHAETVRAFAASPMHRMTRRAEDAAIVAPFRGEALTLGDDRATLETHAGARFVRIDRNLFTPAARPATSLFRVTRVLGGHHREDFVGVPVASYDVAAGLGHDEVVLPVSYLIDRQRLRYKGYSVMVRERPHLEAGPVWDRTCPFCHNTVPLLSTLLGALAGPRAGHYQGEVVDSLLPEDRAFAYRARDEGGLEEAVSREVTRLGGEPARGPLPLVLAGAIDATRRLFTGAKLLEVGIGCESCHGGCREHVADPDVRPSLLPRAPYLDVREGGSEPTSAAGIEAHACARCHQVLFSRYPWTWEGGRRHALAGGSHINSGEARDLLLGGCQGALACTACHDPHAADEAKHLASLETPRGNTVCLTCHAALRAKDALRAHAHHDPDGAAGACLACHMAKKNMSLEGRLTRYHRIGSPTDPTRVLGDRPLECALCHADKSAETLVVTMETWWKKRYDRDVLRRAYGDLDENVMRQTLARGKPHEKAVALAVLGAARDRQAAALFTAELDDEYPLVRDFAVDALHATFGSPCDLHLGEPAAIQKEERRACLQATGGAPDVAPSNRRGPASGAEEPTFD